MINWANHLVIDCQIIVICIVPENKAAFIGWLNISKYTEAILEATIETIPNIWISCCYIRSFHVHRIIPAFRFYKVPVNILTINLENYFLISCMFSYFITMHHPLIT